MIETFPVRSSDPGDPCSVISFASKRVQLVSSSQILDGAGKILEG